MYKTQEICGKVISEDPCLIRYVPDQYKTQTMCAKAVDDCLAALKFVPDCFFTSNMIKKLFTDLHYDEKILYLNEGSSNAVFNCHEIAILNIDLNNINLDDTNYEEDCPGTIILVRLLA